MQNLLNIPNMLTLARIIMTPVIVYMVLSGEAWLALALMVVAGITDMLDGAIARYFNMRTTVGAYLDPLADKILLISLFITLFIVEQVPLFVFLAIIFRDLIIVLGAVTYEIVTRRLTMQPSFISKATTFIQIVYVALLLLNMAIIIPAILLKIAMWLTFLLTCASGLHYLISWTNKAAKQETKI
ncbi:MAG: CDP-diacylglycerol--glycerol-3-phosphate 3-phosphatidyltransferase [Proteobacteria bacterium]|nr:MAG: CDP-diacylglycerol--glycerol-3-phosphate 3-phosphatidyltransferase [Pseudomonadota bacterium]